MTTLPIYQVDAFTDTLFKGNPAAIIPLASWLPDALLQKIAAENNLPETAFIVPSDALGVDYHLRWFTPVSEIDLCGHATVATAFVLRNLLGQSQETFVFSTQVSGLLEVSCNPDGSFSLFFPAYHLQPAPIPDDACAVLGIPAGSVEEAWLGRDLMLVLRQSDAVVEAKPNFSEMIQWSGKGCLITAPGLSPYDVVSRCFFPKERIDEDPVTGSAHCHIVPFWINRLGVKDLLCLQASERSGVLACSMLQEKVVMTGSAVHYLTGSIYLPDTA